ncbi:MAG: hypothetical protein H7Z14_18655 [Anaerolineae bacterium]|nr:hypothetical protein [Phycisphaerae bacterium]
MIYIFDTTGNCRIDRGRTDGVAKSVAALRQSCARLTLGLTLVAVAFIALVTASFAHAAGLPANVVQSLSPPADTITQYIAQAMIDLKSPDPAKQQAGRDALINFVAPAPNPPQPSPTFMSVYSQTLNAQLASIANAPDLRTRLNAAIAVAKVSEKNDNEKLVPTITALLNDKSEAVAIWGMKAAKFVIPRGAEGAKLITQVVAAAQRFPSSTTIAYQALISGPGPSAPVIDAIHLLMKARIDLYNTEIPPDPLAEFPAMLQLVDTKWWNAQNAAQQQKTIQLLTHLASVAGQRVVLNDTAENRDAMSSMIKKISGSIGAIAINTNKPALENKMNELTKGLGKTMTAQQIAAVGAGMVTAIRAEYSTVGPPPTLAATNPAPATTKAGAP